MFSKNVSEFISYIGSAISSCSLYSETHPLVAECAAKALSVLAGLYRDDTVSFTSIGDGIIVNDRPFTGKGSHVTSLMKRLRKKKLEKILFRRGVDLAEMKRFIVAMARPGVVSSSPHISAGIVEVRVRTDGPDFSALLDSGVARVKEAYEGMERFRSLDVAGLDEAVADFILTLKKEVNVLRIVSPVKTYSEYTFVHAANVSVLTIFQAEVLGLAGEILHDIGLAGLLHDIGKMFVPREVIEKRSTLDMKEWREVKRHPLRGALYLSTIEDIPPLAVIATFEHHMKFDGSGYPQRKKNNRKPHMVSQMLAISDYFDALRTERPYRGALDSAAIFELIRKGAGKDFNPLLVDNFLDAVRQIT